jgi:hypothetical protein
MSFFTDLLHFVSEHENVCALLFATRIIYMSGRSGPNNRLR